MGIQSAIEESQVCFVTGIYLQLYLHKLYLSFTSKVNFPLRLKGRQYKTR